MENVQGMQGKRVLVSGASVAGPALAYWLGRYGCEVTVVEKAPALRGGGFAVDFRGPVHLGVLDRMGLTDQVRAMQTNMGAIALLDADGKHTASLPASFAGGDVEIERGDLARILHDHTKDTAEYAFGDSIASLTETADGVDVTFDRGAARTFDLVVGADGMHSNTRWLTFGDESQFLSFSGYYVAGGFSLPNHLGLDHAGVSYGVPGKSVTLASHRRSDELGPLFVFASDEQLAYDRNDIQQQKKILADTYAGVGWEVPRVLDAMWDAPDFYFDSLSQIHMDRWSKGRVVLLGDAAHGATMGGLGTGAAIVGAYVLAGELAAAGGDHRVAFPAYEREMRAYAEGGQKLAGGAGPFLAPGTRGQIWRRNQAYRMMASRLFSGLLDKLTKKAAGAMTLKDYPG